jgi:hypothetical protein
MLEGTAFTILNYLIGIAGGFSAFALAAFTSIGDRLVRLKFDEHLEKYKSGLEAEIEQLRARLGHLSDRGARSNQLEYEALTEAWHKLAEADLATQRCVTRGFEYPDLDRMSQEETEDFFKLSDLSDPQKKFIREAAEKNAALLRVLRSRLIKETSDSIFDAQQVLRSKAIFIPKALEEAFNSVIRLCRSAWAVEKTGFDNPRGFSDADKLRIKYFDESPRAIEELKERVRGHILAAYPARGA